MSKFTIQPHGRLNDWVAEAEPLDEAKDNISLALFDAVAAHLAG